MEKKIYDGDFSMVYRGRYGESDNSLILKVLKGNRPSPEAVKQFQNEYAIVNSFNSDKIIKTHGLKPYGKSLVILFEDFGGVSLSELPVSAGSNVTTLLSFAVDITEALKEIHNSSVLYKNLNPANILVNPANGIIKLIDFSIATRLSIEQPDRPASRLLEGDLAYISPEQTGRVNRPLDYRTDFYSLGVTLYELFTGTLPFPVDDPNELIYSHIALAPPAPHKINTKIPPVLSKIILKLMAKAAEDRYRSCSGLKSDLLICLNSSLEGKGVPDFDIAEHDTPGILKIPETLYGRDQVFKKLLTCCDLAGSAEERMVMVTGYSGVGKTSLVRRVEAMVLERQGSFVSGKFDQVRIEIPYSPLIQSFHKLVRFMLTGTREVIADWKEKFSLSLGANGQLIVDIIPEMELLMGKQPEIPVLAPAEADNRFNITFNNFVRTCATPDNPIVIFLDDMQWANSASLNLLFNLLADRTICGLFVIGSYRSNEVVESHPLMRMLHRLKQENIDVGSIELEPLAVSHINRLLAKTLSCDPEKSYPLAEVSMIKTFGNPFFLKQFLHMLNQERFLTFDYERSIWCWDIEAIQQTGISGNVADLIAGRLEKLALADREVLQKAACIGDEFDLHTLSVISTKSRQETLDALQESIKTGFITPAYDLYNYSVLVENCRLFDIDKSLDYRFFTSTFHFSHDQVQKVCYSLASSDEANQRLHLQIGRLLLENASEKERKRKLFEITGHLNKGMNYMDGGEERLRLARLNLEAGEMARDGSAYAPAHIYIKTGLSLLPDKSWQKAYGLTLALHKNGAETAYLTGQYDEMGKHFRSVLKHGRSLLDKVPAYEVKIRALKAQNKLQEAVDTSLEILRLLGMRIPKKPGKLDVLLAILRTRISFINKSTDDLLSLPVMTDPVQKAVMTFLYSMGTAAYYTVPNLVPIIGARAIRLSLKYGNTHQSTLMGYPTYGFLNCGLPGGNIDTGYAFGKLALDLQKKLFGGKISPMTLYLVNNLIIHWKDHVKETLVPLKEAMQGCLDIGDLEAAANSAYSYSYRLFFLGENLLEITEELEKFGRVMQQLGQKIPLYRQRIYQQAIYNLIMSEKDPDRLTGHYYNEVEMVPVHLESNDKTTLFQVNLVKLINAYIFGHHTRAVIHANAAEKLAGNVVSSLFIPIHNFYDSLAHLALFSRSTAVSNDNILKKIKKNQKKLRKWSGHAPMNYLNKFYLVEAEAARVLNLNERAMDYYDKAIRSARQNGYLQEEALANEVAARYYFGKERRRMAWSYMQEARCCYDWWGAAAKVKQLDDEAGRLFEDMSYRQGPGWVDRKKEISSQLSKPGSNLDLMAVLKASRAMTNEIVLDDLLKMMLGIMMENAGARRGMLLFPDLEAWRIRALGTVQNNIVEVTTEGVSKKQNNLPFGIINYAKRTRADIVLDDARSKGIFVNDDYVVENSSKSIFCSPIVHQQEVSSILFLENNLTAGAFYGERRELLRLLGAQAAIAIKNSLLLTEHAATIQKLHTEMIQRKEAQMQLLHSEKLSAFGRLSASIVHEFGTPIMGMIYLLEAIKSRVKLNEADENLVNLGLNECNRTRKLIQDLRQIYRPSMGKRQEANIHGIINDTLAFQKEFLKSSRIDVVRVYDLTLQEPYVIVDQMTQVFVNLILNASDAMSDEGGTITITTSGTSDRITVAIEDTGCGVRPESEEHLFEPFFSTKDESESTGLGLTVVHRIIENHDGTIMFTSNVGKGTTFTIHLPIQ